MHTYIVTTNDGYVLPVVAPTMTDIYVEMEDAASIRYLGTDPKPPKPKPKKNRATATHCKNGHLWSDDNLTVLKNGRRICRTCKKVGYDKRFPGVAKRQADKAERRLAKRAAKAAARENRLAAKERRRAHNETLRANASAKWAEQRERNRVNRPKYLNSLRQEFLVEYGSKCSCCGEGNAQFLTLDHINRDGAAHRRKVGGHLGMLRDLKLQGWPKDKYRLMCFNCNCGRERSPDKICPHQKC